MANRLASNSPSTPPTPTNVDLVCSAITDNCLRCSNLQTQEEIVIDVDDIICIVPDPKRGQDTYAVLVLLDNPDSGAQTVLSPYLASIQISSPPSALLKQHECTELPPHLRPSSLSNQRVDIHIIVSTLSGTGAAESVFENIVSPFLSKLGVVGYEVHRTQSSRTTVDLAHSVFLAQAQAGVSQTIILLSGDGGLVDLIDVFYSSAETIPIPPNIDVVLIPTGTGNAMANSTGLLSHSTSSALVALLKGKPTPIPAFSASFSPGARYVTEEGRGRAVLGINPKIYGAVVASWGVHAALVADTDTAEYRKFGLDRFKLAASELLFPSSGAETHRYTGTITLSKLDNRGTRCVETLGDKEHMYVLATLVSSLEQNFVISPQTAPLDGRLRIVHFGPVPSDEAMRLLGLAYQGGQHVHEKPVTYTEVEGFRIDFHEEDERWRRICVDGKIIAAEQGGWLEVCKEPRRFIEHNHLCIDAR